MNMKDYTEILIILDRSGSMISCASDTIGGFNSYIQEQQKSNPTARLSLITFSSSPKTIYENVSVKDIDELKDYVPMGSTAMYDAVGMGITKLGQRLNEMPENDRPNKVICVIITDGEENDSRKYNQQQIKDMITEQTNKYNWEFVYLGANQDSWEVSKSIGIMASNTANYDVRNTEQIYGYLSAATTGSARGTRKMAFTAAEYSALVK